MIIKRLSSHSNARVCHCPIVSEAKFSFICHWNTVCYVPLSSQKFTEFIANVPAALCWHLNLLKDNSQNEIVHNLYLLLRELSPFVLSWVVMQVVVMRSLVKQNVSMKIVEMQVVIKIVIKQIVSMIIVVK